MSIGVNSFMGIDGSAILFILRMSTQNFEIHLISLWYQHMLRYKVNILSELKNAGYSSYRLRKEQVLSEGTLQKMRVGDVSIRMESLGEICGILRCQPGDLVEWVPNEPADGQRPSCKHRHVEPGGSNGSP